MNQLHVRPQAHLGTFLLCVLSRVSSGIGWNKGFFHSRHRCIVFPVYEPASCSSSGSPCYETPCCISRRSTCPCHRGFPCDDSARSGRCTPHHRCCRRAEKVPFFHLCSSSPSNGKPFWQGCLR